MIAFIVFIKAVAVVLAKTPTLQFWVAINAIHIRTKIRIDRPIDL